MKSHEYKLRGKVWVYPGDTPWHFVTVDKKTGKEIKEKHAKKERGFGSLRVRVKIGKTTWDTSIFPDRKSGTYLLPIKKEVRKKEGIGDGDAIRFSVEIK